MVLADAGYWHSEQMDQLAADGIPVLIPPDASKRRGQRPGGAAAICLDARAARHRARYSALSKTASDDRAGVRPDQIQPPDRSVPTKRQSSSTLRVAPGGRDTQPVEAPQPSTGRLRGLDAPRNASSRARRTSPGHIRGQSPGDRCNFPRQPPIVAAAGTTHAVKSWESAVRSRPAHVQLIARSGRGAHRVCGGHDAAHAASLAAFVQGQRGFCVFFCRAVHPPHVGEAVSVEPGPAPAGHCAAQAREGWSTRVGWQGARAGGPPERSSVILHVERA